MTLAVLVTLYVTCKIRSVIAVSCLISVFGVRPMTLDCGKKIYKGKRIFCYPGEKFEFVYKGLFSGEVSCHVSQTDFVRKEAAYGAA